MAFRAFMYTSKLERGASQKSLWHEPFKATHPMGIAHTKYHAKYHVRNKRAYETSQGLYRHDA
eukprot:6193649-Pleurochrysis_carterae.AAC.2